MTSPLQSLIKEREEAFDEKFGAMFPVSIKQAKLCGDEIKSFNRTTIRKTLEVVSELQKERMIEVMEKHFPKQNQKDVRYPSPNGHGVVLAYMGLLQADLSAHLTEVLDKM